MDLMMYGLVRCWLESDMAKDQAEEEEEEATFRPNF